MLTATKLHDYLCLYFFFISVCCMFSNQFYTISAIVIHHEQTVKGDVTETRVEKKIIIQGDADIDHDKVGEVSMRESDGQTMFMSRFQQHTFGWNIFSPYGMLLTLHGIHFCVTCLSRKDA